MLHAIAVRFLPSLIPKYLLSAKTRKEKVMLVVQSSKRDNRQKVMDEDVVLWLLMEVSGPRHQRCYPPSSGRSVSPRTIKTQSTLLAGQNILRIVAKTGGR